MPFVGKVNSGDGLSSIGATLYGLCSSLATDEVKIATIEGLDALFVGLTINVKFTNSNRHSTPKLQIPGLSPDPLPIYRNGSTRPGTTEPTSWLPGSVIALTYDGTGWQMVGWINNDTQYQDATRDTHGLLTAAGKRKLDDLNADAVLVFSNIEVPASTWVADSTYADYGFKANLTCTGVTANHAVAVTFLPADLDNYTIAPVAASTTDTVTVYCGIQPTVAITVPSVTAVKTSSV